jgi:hypothetical protein
VTDFDLVCVSHLRWDFVWQRPQQLLTRCARERRVFFVEEPVFGEGGPRLRVRRMNDRLVVAVPELQSGCTPAEADRTQEWLLRALLRDFCVEAFVLWLYTPMAVAFTRTLAPLAVVYDCMDELSAFAHAPDRLTPLEDELFRRADLVLTGGRSLFEAKRARHLNVHLFPSSVDSVHFALARLPGPEPHDQAEIDHPRLGYVGVIDERIDMELVAAVADTRPSWQLVLVGPVAKIDPAGLPRRLNLHYLGPKDYAKLPSDTVHQSHKNARIPRRGVAGRLDPDRRRRAPLRGGRVGAYRGGRGRIRYGRGASDAGELGRAASPSRCLPNGELLGLHVGRH